MLPLLRNGLSFVVYCLVLTRLQKVAVVGLSFIGYFPKEALVYFPGFVL